MLGTSWKTSLIGYIIIIGDVFAFIAKVVQDQGLPSSIVEWIAFAMGLAAGISAILAKDRDVTGLPKAVPVILLAILVMGTTACASYIDYGNGRYGVTRVSEERSPFGTNAGFAYLDNCEGKRANPGATLEFTDCHPITPLSVISSQGQGGVIVSGALNGLGFGLGSAFSGATGATSSAVSSATAGGKGH